MKLFNLNRASLTKRNGACICGEQNGNKNKGL